MESFSKKEKEKLRQKKRKDKQEKKEDRKATAQKGQPLDQMMAYVDENGNISSTPPDPRRKRQINEEDIQIGVAKQDDEAPQEVTRQGVVTFFNASKGYGFIKDQQNQASIFVHINALTEPINEMDKVTFAITMTPKGPNAVDVKKIV
ncbi:cold-shock protein [Spirosoma utsteinense]|uniref:Cold shock CspA family protein n=1 Tax=Spirosoma utsteinense TaxID=2585773 RepID=A0ABR6VZ74_9BACT|nr:cold shock domain-containing protein [Spirosoma utsteinense]MBC3784625.1 cold shock CspA family protein [Spirosoma utsteinense]MBC3789622.1 cold shock CspA family protein [Spirosoma utsteinense]